MKNIFSIQKPDQGALPLIFDSPHSGTVLPRDFDFICDPADLARAEDKFVDALFAGAPAHGAALLCAKIHRAYIDLNRAIDDIDLHILENRDWPADTFGPIAPTLRSDSGIGLIRRLIRPGVPLYGHALTPEQVWNRIQTYYIPYHKKLEELIENAHFNFGEVWHINCHSMPNSSARPHRPLGLRGTQPRTADFVIGDRDSTTASLHFTHAIRNFLRNLGYTVTINDPYKGVELIRRYSNPSRGYHSVQIEINKSLYMNEDKLEKNSNYNILSADIDKLVAFLSGYVSAQLIPRAAD